MDEYSTMARNRIMTTAARHYAERKYTAVHLSDISDDLNVDRAVVKQFFPTREDLLTALIDSFLQNIEDILTTFVDSALLPAIKDGALEIRNDRFHFANPQRAAVFSDHVVDHLDAIFDYLLVHSDDYLLFVQESYMLGAHSGCLEKLLRLFLPVEENPLFIKRELPGIRLSPQEQVSFVQTIVFPILGYALFKVNLDQLSQHCAETHKQTILGDIRGIISRHTIGQDILFAREK